MNYIIKINLCQKCRKGTAKGIGETISVEEIFELGIKY